MPSRRRFLQSNLLAGAGLLLPGHTGASAETLPDLDVPAPEALDLTPARWIWYPSGRTLANTFILLRREIDLPTRPTEARGKDRQGPRGGGRRTGSRRGTEPEPDHRT